MRDADMMRKMVLGCSGTETATFNAGVNPLAKKSKWYHIDAKFDKGFPGPVDRKCDRNCLLLNESTPPAECWAGCFVYETNDDERRLRGLTREIFDGCKLRVEHFHRKGQGIDCIPTESTCAFKLCNLDDDTC